MNFDEAYEGAPPWEIGRPQPEVVRLAEAGAFRGSVLDAGCGTGENTLYLAAHGCPILGIDASQTAIRKAREKSVLRGFKVRFKVLDARELHKLDQKFDTILDCGLYHVFSNEKRIEYVNSLQSALAPNGAVYVLCFSEREPAGWGPRRVTRAEIKESFAENWRVNYIREAGFDTTVQDRPVFAWLASITLKASGQQSP